MMMSSEILEDLEMEEEEWEEHPMDEKRFKIIVDSYGMHKNPYQKIVKRYTLINPSGFSVQVIDYGATITAINFPDRYGKIKDVLLGYQKLDGYKCNLNQYLGATTGRYSGVIEAGRYAYQSNHVQLSTNVVRHSRGCTKWHHLNGGMEGFDREVWDSYRTSDRVVMTHISPDGDEGYPGDLIVQVSFSLTPDDSLLIQTSAWSSHPTPICITHHPYFNLVHHGMGVQGLKEHIILINADKYVEINDRTGLPTGELKPVTKTIFDLRMPCLMSNIINSTPEGGYNVTFCLPKEHQTSDIMFAARVYHPPTGRMLEVLTDHPGIHLDTTTSTQISNGFVRQERPEADIIQLPLIKEDKECRFCKSKTLPFESRENYYRTCKDNTNKDDERVCDSWSATSWDDEDESECWSDDEEDMQKEWPRPEPETIIGKQGIRYRANCALSLWPTEFPNSPNHGNFPNPILNPGETYSRTVVYRFRVVKEAKEEELFKDIPSWTMLSKSLVDLNARTRSSIRKSKKSQSNSERLKR